MACKNFKNALNWFAIEIVTMVLLIYLAITRKYVLMLILLLETVMYVVIPNWMSERILTDMRYLEKRKCKNVVLFMREVLFWLLIHSAGPLITFCKLLLRKNKQKNKYKTEKSV